MLGEDPKRKERGMSLAKHTVVKERKKASKKERKKGVEGHLSLLLLLLLLCVCVWKVGLRMEHVSQN